MLDPDLIPTPLRAIPDGVARQQPALTKETVWGRLGALLQFIADLLRLAVRGRMNNQTRAAALRRLFESLGCTWIKLGQIMAMRRDFFSTEFCQEMSSVQDRAARFPVASAREILERNLKAPVDRIFDGFGDSVAAASVGQVHSATLRRNGRRVAIKVRRPGIAVQVRKDLRMMDWAVRLIRRLSIRETFAWESLMWELRLALLDELDYRLESASLKKMRKTLTPHGIYVPRVFVEYTTEEILVMEYVQGVPMSDFVSVLHEDPDKLQRWLIENEIDPEKVGSKLYLSLSRQIFEDNLFHGDLHPGNIILLRRSQIALIDFGAVGSMDVQFIEKFRLYNKSVTERDYDAAVDVLLMLAPQPSDATSAELFRRRYLAMLRNFEFQTSTATLPYHDRSVVHAFSKVMRELSDLGIPLEWTFMRLHRAQLTLDASLMFLIPNVNYIELTRTYFEQAANRSIAQSTSREARRRFLVTSFGLADLALNQIEEDISTSLELLLQDAKFIKPLVGKMAGIWFGLGKTLWAGLSIVCIAAILLLAGSPLNRPVVWVFPWTQNAPVATRVCLTAVILYLQTRTRRLFSQS